MLRTYQDEFEGWTVHHFSIAEPEARKILKQALRNRGIYLGPTAGHINKQLFALLTAQSLPEWDENELIKQANLDPRSHFFEYRRRLIPNQHEASKHLKMPALPPMLPMSQSSRHSEKVQTMENKCDTKQFTETIHPYNPSLYPQYTEEPTRNTMMISQENFDYYRSLPTEETYYGLEETYTTC